MEKYGQFCDRVLLGCLSFALCIPVLTIGAAASSMYYTVSKVLNRGEGYLFRTCWEQWKANLKRGILFTVLILLYTAVGALDVYLVYRLVETGSAPEFFRVLIWLFFLPEVIVLPWIFAYTARFNDTVGNTLKNCLRLGFSSPGKTLLCDLEVVLLAVLAVVAPPLIPFFLTPLTRLWVRWTEPALLEVAKNTEGFDPDAWYNREPEITEKQKKLENKEEQQ